MKPNAILLVLVGLFVTASFIYAIQPNENTKYMFIGTLALAVLYCAYMKFIAFLDKNKSEPTLIGAAHNGKKKLVIRSNKFKFSKKNYEYSLSFWFKVNGWNYRYGSQKVILNKDNTPKIYLDNFNPTLIVNQAVYNPESESKGKIERIWGTTYNTVHRVCGVGSGGQQHPPENITEKY